MLLAAWKQHKTTCLRRVRAMMLRHDRLSAYLVISMAVTLLADGRIWLGSYDGPDPRGSQHPLSGSHVQSY